MVTEFKFGISVTIFYINSLSAKPSKWPNTLNNCLSVFDHFVKLAVKGLKSTYVLDFTLRDFVLMFLWCLFIIYII